MPAPGWYPCPSSAPQLRYFDGDTWTGDVRPLPTDQPAAAPVQPPSPAYGAYPMPVPAPQLLAKAPVPSGKGKARPALAAVLILLVMVRSIRLFSSGFSDGAAPLLIALALVVIILGVVLYPILTSTKKTKQQAEAAGFPWSEMVSVTRDSFASLGAWKSTKTTGAPVLCRVASDGARLHLFPGKGLGTGKAREVDVDLSTVVGTSAGQVADGTVVLKDAVILHLQDPSGREAHVTIVLSGPKTAAKFAASPLARFFT